VVEGRRLVARGELADPVRDPHGRRVAHTS
jgi:hypothetical protein